jgi:acyl carrier protein
MSLQDRLITFIEEQNVELNCDLNENTSLIKSGLFDSLALFNLAIWIEEEISTHIDPTTFDLSKEWDTIADIINFIQKQRGNNRGKNIFIENS